MTSYFILTNCIVHNILRRDGFVTLFDSTTAAPSGQRHLRRKELLAPLAGCNAKAPPELQWKKAFLLVAAWS
jgi:hypothetical protein